jgi:hypothetical protein
VSGVNWVVRAFLVVFLLICAQGCVLTVIHKLWLPAGVFAFCALAAGAMLWALHHSSKARRDMDGVT